MALTKQHQFDDVREIISNLSPDEINSIKRFVKVLRSGGTPQQITQAAQVLSGRSLKAVAVLFESVLEQSKGA